MLLAFDLSSIRTILAFHYERKSCKGCKQEMMEDEQRGP